MIRTKSDFTDYVLDLLKEHGHENVKMAFEDGTFLAQIPYHEDVAEKDRVMWQDDVHWAL